MDKIHEIQNGALKALFEQVKTTYEEVTRLRTDMWVKWNLHEVAGLVGLCSGLPRQTQSLRRLYIYDIYRKIVVRSTPNGLVPRHFGSPPGATCSRSITVQLDTIAAEFERLLTEQWTVSVYAL